MSEKVKIVAVSGPTATGKTALAVKLAALFDGEIVSVDSRQVYRYMDLGTGKDLEEYGEIPYHLIDIADPASETYNLSCFCRDAFAAIDDIRKRNKLPVLCGGTALYLDALLKGYWLPGGQLPEREKGVARSKADYEAEPSFTPPFELDPLVIGVLFDRKTVRERIEKRLDARFEAGMVEEVRKLHDIQKVPYEKLEFFGLEYREIAQYLQEKCSFEEMRQSLLDKIRQFAKRQDIFFRKIERSGQDIYWCREGKEPDPVALVKQFLAGAQLPEITFRLADVDYGKKK
ncbi:MAG: tRNA (adenosine(37)-N6)-dimethylallyltransferase MiaA [Lentisphaeria bacterium]|nr:tRNA (adenosine(37)-N6)-dimethylallyltransferase MiaA [Lentisphaeria bacterium]